MEPDSRLRRGLAVVAFVVAVGLVAAGIVLVPPAPAASSPTPLPPPALSLPAPTQEVQLSRGNLTFFLTLLTLYEVEYNGTNFTTSTSVSFSETPSDASNFTFSWSLTDGSPLRVRFVEQGVTDPRGPSWDGSFRPFSVGRCRLPCARITLGLTPAISGYGALLVGSAERIPYEVWRVNLAPPFEAVAWLEVRYRQPEPAVQMAFLPAAGVTWPAPADLVALGSPVTVHFGSDFPLGATFDVRDLVSPESVFHFALPGLAVDLGALGSLPVRLTSSFSWTDLTTYRITLVGMASPTTGSSADFQIFVDMRFGTLLVRPVV